MLDWALKYAVPLAGLVGAMLYGMLRLAYLFFYLQVRATPEEVGYGYSEILASQLIGAIQLVIMATIVLGVSALICWMVGSQVRWLFRQVGVRPRLLLSRRAVMTVAGRSTVAGVVVVLAALPLAAWAEGAQAAQGFTVRNVYLKWTSRLPVLAVAAVPSTLTWVAGSSDGGFDLADKECLMYLGQANGTSVFYDVATEDSVRIPTGDVIVILRNSESVPADC